MLFLPWDQLGGWRVGGERGTAKEQSQQRTAQNIPQSSCGFWEGQIKEEVGDEEENRSAVPGWCTHNGQTVMTDTLWTQWPRSWLRSGQGRTTNPFCNSCQMTLHWCVHTRWLIRFETTLPYRKSGITQDSKYKCTQCTVQCTDGGIRNETEWISFILECDEKFHKKNTKCCRCYVLMMMALPYLILIVYSQMNI